MGRRLTYTASRGGSGHATIDDHTTSAIGACREAATSRTLRVATTEGGMTRASTRAERQQKFLANRFVDLVEIQRRLAFIAQHFEYGRAALLRDFDSRVLEMDHMHLEGLDKKILVVPTAGTGQCHT